MSNNNGKGREIFYGVIGVATLVVAIMGATFAYFTASTTNNDAITGNAATISLSVAVSKVTNADVEFGGMIPMSNSMVEPAVSKYDGDLVGKNEGVLTDTDKKGVCTDDAGNAVCQVYKITLTNKSTAAIMVDGYVALKGGSGTATDYSQTGIKNATTMRWAQAFCTGEGDSLACSTGGSTSLGATDELTITSLDNSGATDGKNSANIRDQYKTYTDGVTSVGGVTFEVDAAKGVIGSAEIAGSTYPVIGKNYIRVSNHTFSGDDFSATEAYTRANDVTSALVFNQRVRGKTGAETGVDQTFYIVVWLQENGSNQTLAGDAATDFFSGQVKFISAYGSEVSATFGGFTRVARTD